MLEIDINSIDGETIKQNLLSKNKDLIVEAACVVLRLATEPIEKRRDLLKPSFNSLEEIKEAVVGVNLGGGVSNKNLWLEGALEIIEMNNREECPCQIAIQVRYGLNAEGRARYQGFSLIKSSRSISEYVDAGIIECPVCHQRYKITDEYTGGFANVTGWSKIDM